MSGVAVALPRPASLRFLMGFVAGALPVLALVIFGLLPPGSGSQSQRGAQESGDGHLRVERAELRSYESQLEPLIDRGAFLVAQGMMPGLADIADGAFEDAVLVTMAEGWLSGMENLRREFAALEPPEFLAEASERFDDALAAYVATAEELLAAARAGGDERAALVESVTPLGRRADALFEAARAELEHQRQRLGLGE